MGRRRAAHPRRGPGPLGPAAPFGRGAGGGDVGPDTGPGLLDGAVRDDALPAGGDAAAVERHRAGRGFDWAAAPLVRFNDKDDIQQRILDRHGVTSAPPTHEVPDGGGFVTAVRCRPRVGCAADGAARAAPRDGRARAARGRATASTCPSTGSAGDCHRRTSTASASSSARSPGAPDAAPETSRTESGRHIGQDGRTRETCAGRRAARLRWAGKHLPLGARMPSLSRGGRPR